MSTNAKGTSIEKIIKEFDKNDIDEKVKIYFALKESLTADLISRQQDTEDKLNKIQDTKERL